MSTFLQDLKYSLRLLVKSPGFAAAAIAVLALGIGLNTAMFSIVNALAFSPRPFPEPERVVQLYTQDEKDPAAFRAFSYSSYRELRQRNDVFSGVLAHTMTMVGIGEGRDNRRTFGSLVSSNYFETLRVPLLRGRAFTAAEEKPGARIPVVIVSHLYWKKTGFQPDLVGSTVRVNDRPFTVVGITPPNFTGTIMMIGPELYFPFGMFDALANDFEGRSQQSLEKIDTYNLFLVARLAPGVSRATANAALAGIADGLEQQHPVEHKAQNFIVGDLPRLSTSTNPSNESALKTLSLVLLALTGAVLLIVCFNLASLLFARGHARRKEFAIRLALGGGRGRIIRQLLTEGLVLALAGGALGLGLANWSSELLVRALGSRVPVALFLDSASPAVVAAMLAFCTLATLGFALGPALKFSQPDLLTDLKTQAGEDVAKKRRRWLPRHPLVVAQIALSLALLITAGLFVRLALDATNYETGYRADDTVLAEVDASLANYDAARARETYRVIEERLRAMPGVSVASLGAIVPQGMVNLSRGVRRAGVTPPTDHKPATAAEGRDYSARWNAIGAGYFEAMGIPLLRGRAFTDAEAFGSTTPTVVIIDETLAKKLWPDGDALGQRVQWDADSATRLGVKAGETLPSLEVVGIARPTRDGYEQREMGIAVYVPFAQGFMSNVFFHVRPALATPLAAQALIDGVRRELQAAAPGVPVFKVTTFREHRDASIEVWGLRLIGMLFVLFSGLALVIAVIGLYGVKAHAVSRRTREIGIRLALGAEPRAVRNLILREGLRLTLAGLFLGLALGAAAGRLMSGLFASMPAFDPAALFVSAAALLAAASLACWLPARRATKVDPMVALRTE